MDTYKSWVSLCFKRACYCIWCLTIVQPYFIICECHTFSHTHIWYSLVKWYVQSITGITLHIYTLLSHSCQFELILLHNFYSLLKNSSPSTVRRVPLHLHMTHLQALSLNILLKTIWLNSYFPPTCVTENVNFSFNHVCEVHLHFINETKPVNWLKIIFLRQIHSIILSIKLFSKVYIGY